MKIAYSILLFLSAFIPGLIIIKLQKPLKFDLKYLLVFAGAFIFSITIVHLLPELFSASSNPRMIGVFVLVGFFMQIFLDFITTIVFAFGLAFEVPVATVLIVWTGLTTPDKLGKARPYVFLGAFIMGMFLTPPDVISQTLLAVPVYLLYELGIIMSKVFVIRKEDPEEELPSEDG